MEGGESAGGVEWGVANVRSGVAAGGVGGISEMLGTGSLSDIAGVESSGIAGIIGVG